MDPGEGNKPALYDCKIAKDNGLHMLWDFKQVISLKWFTGFAQVKQQGRKYCYTTAVKLLNIIGGFIFINSRSDEGSYCYSNHSFIFMHSLEHVSVHLRQLVDTLIRWDLPF